MEKGAHVQAGRADPQGKRRLLEILGKWKSCIFKDGERSLRATYRWLTCYGSVDGIMT